MSVQASIQEIPIVPDYNIGGLLWPMPAMITQKTDIYTINPNSFTFSAVEKSNSILQRAFERYLLLCFPNTTLNQKLGQGYLVNQTLLVNVAQASEDDIIQLGVDESYILEITSAGWELTSVGVFGALRGLETFSQLIMHNGTSYSILETKILDSPRFPWRGLLIDTSRHWLPVESILDTIRAMSYSKMNTLHWHIVDGQSFPLESKLYPLLSLSGAYRPNQVYTQSDVLRIVSFANDHGVRIVPEFDMPAHASSWGFGYDFMTIKCFSRRDPYDFNDGWGDNPMDPTNPAVYDFVQNFLTEAVTLFPDHWLHLGGDEISYSCWNTTKINNYMKQNNIKTYKDLEAYFISTINNYIKKNLNKNVAYWQEVYASTSPFIGNAVDVWLDSHTLSNVIDEGLYAIQSFGWYLDHLDSDWYDYYKQDPVPVNATQEQIKYILGGEASMWAESVDVTNLHQKVWPRASSVAERLWSPITVTDPVSAIHRLSQHRCRYVSRGIPASPFQPGPGCY